MQKVILGTILSINTSHLCKLIFFFDMMTKDFYDTIYKSLMSLDNFYKDFIKIYEPHHELFPTTSDTNLAVHPQKTVRGLKFQI